MHPNNGNTFAWDGRTFCGAWVGPGYFYAYTYDDEGRLTQKTGEGYTTNYVYDGDRLIAEMHDWYTIVYVYDHGNVPIGMKYRATDDTLWTNYWFEKNLQGDIIAIWDNWGVKLLSYTYDAWGNFTQQLHYNDGVGGFYRNNFRYRGYYYDSDLSLYRTQTRLYDANTGRFISPDKFVSTGQGILGNNMYLYCGNDPVNRVDPSGHAWYHWLIGAAVVAVCAVAVVVTAGGAAAGVAAVASVAGGTAATTTASTIAAGTFIGTSLAYGSAVFSAASTSDSIEEFNEQGNWGTVTTTILGGLTGAVEGYDISKTKSVTVVDEASTFLPDEYYLKNKAPKFSTPYSSAQTVRYNSYTNSFETSTTYYDYAGRQSIRIDWTNHGRANHGNPHVHYKIYTKEYPCGYPIRLD